MRARAPSEVAPTDREANWAVAVAGGLYLVGALLCATGALLPELRSPWAIGGVGVVAFTTGLVLLLVSSRGRGTLTIAFLADLWGIVLIATLCAGSSGTGSPFALIYMFAIGHAAAFQPRDRLYTVALGSLVAFLAPIVYEAGVSTEFAAVACVGIVLALMTSAAVHFALNRIREQRRRLQILGAATASLDRSLDPAETLRAISRMAVPELVPVCVVDVLDATGSIGSTVAAAADPALAREIEASPAGSAAGRPATSTGSRTCSTSHRRVSPAAPGRRRRRRRRRRSRAPARAGTRRERPGGGRARARGRDGAGRLCLRGRLPDARPRTHPRDDHLLAPAVRPPVRPGPGDRARGPQRPSRARLRQRPAVCRARPGGAHAAAQPDALRAAHDPGARARQLLPPDGRRQRGGRRLLRRHLRQRGLLAGRRRRLREGGRGGGADGLRAPHDGGLRPRNRTPRPGPDARQPGDARAGLRRPASPPRS